MVILVVHKDKQFFLRLKEGLEKAGHKCFYTPVTAGVIYSIEAATKKGTPIDVIFTHLEIDTSQEARLKELSPDTQIITVYGSVSMARLHSRAESEAFDQARLSELMKNKKKL